jgi:hypothetical protein
MAGTAAAMALAKTSPLRCLGDALFVQSSRPLVQPLENDVLEDARSASAERTTATKQRGSDHSSAVPVRYASMSRP